MENFQILSKLIPDEPPFMSEYKLWFWLKAPHVSFMSKPICFSSDSFWESPCIPLLKCTLARADFRCALRLNIYTLTWEQNNRFYCRINKYKQKDRHIPLIKDLIRNNMRQRARHPHSSTVRAHQVLNMEPKLQDPPSSDFWLYGSVVTSTLPIELWICCSLYTAPQYREVLTHHHSTWKNILSRQIGSLCSITWKWYGSVGNI